MNALDTNVLVRLITNDDPAMRDAAARIIEAAQQNGEELLFPMPALLECLWVLDARYGFSRTEILNTIERLLLVKGLRFEAQGRVRELIGLARTTTVDLSDILIGLSARDLGCETTLTFDKKASRSPLFKRIQ